MHIDFAPIIRERCPGLVLGIVESTVRVAPAGSDLQALADEYSARLAASTAMEAISRQAPIRAAREAYKALGKKPGRYRPSAEALLRRVVSGKGLYHINNVVDLLNLLSIDTGFSIGGYDLERIEGPVTMDIGRENEPYDAIARGQLNIGRLPCLRDTHGAFGTPTSDSERTRIRPETTSVGFVFFAFGGAAGLDALCRRSLQGLAAYGGGANGRYRLLGPTGEIGPLPREDV